MDNETMDCWSRFERKIAQMRTSPYLPRPLVDLVEQVAQTQLADGGPRPEMPDASRLADAASMLQGAPLLPRSEFPYDAAHAEALFDRLLAGLRGAEGAMAEAALIVEEALREGRLSADETFRRLLADDAAFFELWAERTPGTPHAAHFLAQASLMPSLRAAARELAVRLPQLNIHAFGHCPICGSLPLVSTLRGKEGTRHATCSFCSHEYRIQRLACPFCDEKDQQQLKFFHVPEQPGYRVDVCATCKSYIKTADFRELDREPLPVLDDLESLPLDILAQNEGYRRPTLSAFPGVWAPGEEGSARIDRADD